MEIEDIWQPGRLPACLNELRKTSNELIDLIAQYIVMMSCVIPLGHAPEKIKPILCFSVQVK